MVLVGKAWKVEPYSSGFIYEEVCTDEIIHTQLSAPSKPSKSYL